MARSVKAPLADMADKVVRELLRAGHTVNLGRARLTGNTSVEQKLPLKGLKDRPKRALINYYDDVLALPN